MEKTGRQRIQKKGRKGNPARCTNCGREGVYRVRFEDRYGKVEVTLCEECDKLRYEQLKLQTTFTWPVTRGKNV